VLLNLLIFQKLAYEKVKDLKKKIHIRFDIWKIDTAISTFRIFVA
jgi:hypothetical protein